MKLSIVLYLGTVLLVTAAAAPQKRNPIDFLLDYNQDVLINDTEVPASVKPLTLAQVSSGTEDSWRNQQQQSLQEEIADVQETQDDSRSNEKQSPEDQEDSEEANNSDDQNQASNDSQKNQDQEENKSDTNEQQSKEDTTIRVYDDDEEDTQLKEETQDVNAPNNSNQNNQTQTQRVLSHEDRAAVNNAKDLESQSISSEESVPLSNDFYPERAIAHNTQDVQIQPDQLFNHGSLVFEKGSFVSQKPEFIATTPFNVKSWEGQHRTDPESWHPKYDFLDNEQGDRFTGPPPTWTHWNHNHQQNKHDHPGFRHNHDHDHDEAEFHNHGFHRGGPWKWH
ncbi:germ cell nuclear acidic protein-like [Wyeomyia smithii]|uniref:germ cell nuclear acidic protein-like n=1 Tax=Wyeomyia smithii TaxID=174621 RepID=UPI002467BCAC|nr:germ cell nuclear acidic protein-like [Wyeomyia smithii]